MKVTVGVTNGLKASKKSLFVQSITPAGNPVEIKYVEPPKQVKLPFKPDPKAKILKINFYTQDQSFNLDHFKVKKNLPGRVKEVKFIEAGKRQWTMYFAWSEIASSQKQKQQIDLGPANVEAGVKD
jgi:hypothetical protein